MRIALFSDLHRECSTIELASYVKDADVVVLAGDIDEGLKGVEWAKSIPKPVIYVPGNHEYDYGNIPELNAAYNADCWLSVSSSKLPSSSGPISLRVVRNGWPVLPWMSHRVTGYALG